MINVFSSELTGCDESYKITTLIWGKTNAIERLESEIAHALEINQHPFDFTNPEGLNQVDWNVFRPIYQQILDNLIRRTDKDEFSLLIDIVSAEQFRENSTGLVNGMMNTIKASESLGMAFRMLDQEEEQAVSKFVPLLIPLMLHRGEMGNTNSIYQYFPEVTPELHDYNTGLSRFQGIFPATIKMSLFETISMIGDAFMKPLTGELYLQGNNADFKRLPYQYLDEFQPMPFYKSKFITICKVVSHLTNCFILKTLERNNSTTRLNGELADRYLDLSQYIDKFKTAIRLNRGNLTCVDSNLWMKIFLPRRD